MFDVVALGESLIDCTPAGKNEQGMELFSANPGGAPANMLAMNSKLGGKTAFIGKVGRDAFGDFLMHTMERAGIDVRGLSGRMHIRPRWHLCSWTKRGSVPSAFIVSPVQT